MCNNRQKIEAIRNNNKKWDNKFGVVDHEEFDNLTWRAREQAEAAEEALGLKKIEGIGKDAEIITNERGGKQSKSPMALHLLDPEFLEEWADDRAIELQYQDRNGYTCVDGVDTVNHSIYRAIGFIAEFMKDGDKYFLDAALSLLEPDSLKQIQRIAKVLQYGASRYKANNWRLIPQEEHINHALIHLIAQLAGDTQDDHIDHALCRLMMAYATRKSDDFDYSHFVDTNIYENN